MSKNKNSNDFSRQKLINKFRYKSRVPKNKEKAVLVYFFSSFFIHFIFALAIDPGELKRNSL